MANLELRRLGPEPWGRRLERARYEAGLTFREVEEILFPHISKSGVVRLERRWDAPTTRKDRGRAALVILLYGFELDDFEISEADIPPVIDLRALERMRKRMPSRSGVAVRNRCSGSVEAIAA
ncbi:MAG TPA: hypothetical protein VGH66_15240 [Acidimicrobiales bacterium]|jgi:hypothetical protein